MTELTNENIELRKTTANAIQKIMTNSGNIAFLNNAIERFLTELKEQNKECEPAALMMTGALMGFTLHELTTNDENAALKKQVEILDDEAVTVQITQEQYEEYLQLQKKNDVLKNEQFTFEELIKTQEEQLEPFNDEYFKNMDTKTIAELAKKSIRLTSENRKLEEECEKQKIKVVEILSEKENLYENNEILNETNTHLQYMLDDVIEKVMKDDDDDEYFYTELKEKFTSKLGKIIDQNNKYNQALNNVESLLKTITETNKVYPLQTNLQKCLEIISKAKRGDGNAE